MKNKIIKDNLSHDFMMYILACHSLLQLKKNLKRCKKGSKNYKQNILYIIQRKSDIVKYEHSIWDSIGKIQNEK